MPTPDQASEAITLAKTAEEMFLELIDDLFAHLSLPQRLVDKHAAFKAASNPQNEASK